MKLIHTDFGIEMELRKLQVAVLTLENPNTFAEIIQDIYRQSNGEEGKMILSDGEKILPMDRSLELVLDPFTLDLNNKKVHAKLYHEIKEESDENFFEDVMRLNANIQSYLEKVVSKVPYPITFRSELDILNLYKLYDLGIDIQDITLADKVFDYTKLMAQLCRIPCMVFVNLKSYLNTEQLLEFYKTAFLNDMILVLIESSAYPALEGEHHYILDKDNCLIEY